MNIGEVVAALEALAEQLPDGRATQVQVHICNGSDEPGLFTSSIEVDVMTIMSKDVQTARESFVVVQGHPHRDQASSTSRPMTGGVEDVVAQWSADFAERGSSRSPLKLDYSTDPETGLTYLLLPTGDGATVRFELGEGGGIRYRPGAGDAVAAGCLCDPVKNNAGGGAARDDGVAFIFRRDCPVHLQIPLGPAEES